MPNFGNTGHLSVPSQGKTGMSISVPMAECGQIDR